MAALKNVQYLVFITHRPPPSLPPIINDRSLCVMRPQRESNPWPQRWKVLAQTTEVQYREGQYVLRNDSFTASPQVEKDLRESFSKKCVNSINSTTEFIFLEVWNMNTFVMWVQTIGLLHFSPPPPPPHGGYWNFQTPIPKIQQKKEFPREGLNFKENLWEFHGVG